MVGCCFCKYTIDKGFHYKSLLFSVEHVYKIHAVKSRWQYVHAMVTVSTAPVNVSDVAQSVGKLGLNNWRHNMASRSMVVDEVMPILSSMFDISVAKTSTSIILNVRKPSIVFCKKMFQSASVT